VIFNRITLATSLVCACLAVQPREAWSHAADAMAAPPGAVVIAPRTEARAGGTEIVGIFSKQIFAVFLSGYADGAPVTGAKVEADTDLQSAKLTETDPGIYSSKELLMAPGRNDLTLKFTINGVASTKALTLTTPIEAAEAPVSRPAISTAGPVAIGGAVAAVYALLSAAFLLARRPQHRAMARVVARARRAEG